MHKFSLFFKTLGTELKIGIITCLKDKSLSVNEIAHKLNEERSNVSHALKCLLDCNFVSVRKKGRNCIYSLNKETILPLLNLVEKHMKKYCKLCKHHGGLNNE
ncbi:winged helix-turn-helix transcriptional regulator [Candidatus Woesearchaeota archaeon]|nr:winged helix-turn-helix transcriptional regulator [Candidatus Woesearchaeota archaeon]